MLHVAYRSRASFSSVQILYGYHLLSLDHRHSGLRTSATVLDIVYHSLHLLSYTLPLDDYIARFLDTYRTYCCEEIPQIFSAREQAELSGLPEFNDCNHISITGVVDYSVQELEIDLCSKSASSTLG
jgi:hypothetical protein